ncbi:unnamed protein product [Zymoseptoria tritici ST99CH_1A5]|uniref:Uncharacterized protein n=1 Tax=Zymoseptoria tritici ST99CH_1A5 TaxID=1276529 RepID=A0A1Y6M0Y8_ZYMTR|nr:unnamed protein product [Zymoseptoria tritici ST99CH_1A5]
MSNTSCPPLPEDEDLLHYLSLLETRAPPLFLSTPTLTRTHLAITHLLHKYRVRCPYCQGNRHRHRAAPPSSKALVAMSKLTLLRLRVMSQRRLLTYLRPIAMDWMCRKCFSSKTMNSGKQRIALEWVRELRHVLAMLARRDDLATGQLRPQPALIDITRTPPSTSHDDDTHCIICADSISSPANEKACFQCSNVIHQTCFDQYAAFEDLNQEATSHAEPSVLNLPCVFCRCIVLSVPRSEAGRVAWEERTHAREVADAAYARAMADAEEEEGDGYDAPEL